MQNDTLASAMYQIHLAIENCQRTKNTEWLAKHRATMAKLVALLPSGSGIDNGTKLVEITDEKIVLSCGFHHMNDQGSYDGWTEHTITIRPRFTGLGVKVSGRDRNEIKDYLYDTFYTAMSETVDMGAL